MKSEARRLLLARHGSLRAQGSENDQELHDIAEALQRLDDGTWGHCEHCGGAIGRARLRAVPEARSCLPCASDR